MVRRLLPALQIFISFIHHSFHGNCDPYNKLSCSQLCRFIAQLVEHCTGIPEVMGSNPVEATRISEVF